MSDPTYDIDELSERRNRIRVGHLVLGLVFLGLALSWALRASGVIGDPETGVVVPGVLVAAGVAGLAVTLVGSRRRRAPVAAGDHPAYETELTDNTNDDTKEIDR